MRKAYSWLVAAASVAALVSCDGGDDGGGAGPTPGGGGGAGVWLADKDQTLHKFSLDGGSLATVGGFV